MIVGSLHLHCTVTGDQWTYPDKVKDGMLWFILFDKTDETYRVKRYGAKCVHHGRNCFLEPRTFKIEVKTATPVKVY